MRTIDCIQSTKHQIGASENIRRAYCGGLNCIWCYNPSRSLATNSLSIQITLSTVRNHFIGNILVNMRRLPQALQGKVNKSEMMCFRQTAEHFNSLSSLDRPSHKLITSLPTKPYTITRPNKSHNRAKHTHKQTDTYTSHLPLSNCVEFAAKKSISAYSRDSKISFIYILLSVS